MNREIKFRAWKTQEKIMLWRGLFDMNWYHTEKNDELGAHCWGAISGGQKRFLEIMQFTGLKDKNGKEVYEGDILEFVENDESKTLLQIDYDNDLCAFVAYKDNGWHFNDGRYYEWNNCEVIGNIYENSELIK